MDTSTTRDEPIRPKHRGRIAPTTIAAAAWAVALALAYGWAAARFLPLAGWARAGAFLAGAGIVFGMWIVVALLRSHRLALDPHSALIHSAVLLTPFVSIVPSLLEPALIDLSPGPHRIAAILAFPWAGLLVSNWVLGTREEIAHPVGTVAWIAAAAWGLLTGLSILRFRVFQEPGFGIETAYFAQCFWSTLHGGFFSGPLLGNLVRPVISTHFAVHFSPVFLGILPFFAVLPHALTLVVLRNAALTAVVVPTYRIARRYFEPRAAVLAALLPLAHPALWTQTQADLSFLPFAVFPLLMAVDSAFRNRWPPFVLWSAAALTVREDVAVAVLVLGVWAAIVNRRFRWLSVSILAVAWFALAAGVVIPRCGPQEVGVVDRTLSSPTIPVGDLESLRTVTRRAKEIHGILPALTTSASALYIFAMLRPTLFLGLLSPLALVAVPPLLLNILAAASPLGRLDTTDPQSVIPAALFATAAICMLGPTTRRICSRLDDHWMETVHVQWIILATLLLASLLATPPGAWKSFLPVPGREREARAAREAIARIGSGESVAASAPYLADLARRRRLFLFELLPEYPGDPLPDCILVNTHVRSLDLEMDRREMYRTALDRIQMDPRYTPVFEDEGIVLFRKRN